MREITLSRAFELLGLRLYVPKYTWRECLNVVEVGNVGVEIRGGNALRSGL